MNLARAAATPLPVIEWTHWEMTMDPTTAALYIAVSRYVACVQGDGCRGSIARWRALTEALAAFEAAHGEDCEPRAEDAERADGAA